MKRRNRATTHIITGHLLATQARFNQGKNSKIWPRDEETRRENAKKGGRASAINKGKKGLPPFTPPEGK